MQTSKNVLQNALFLKSNKNGLRVVIVKKKVVQTKYNNSKYVVHIWKNQYIEIVDIVDLVVEKTNIARYIRVIDKINILEVVLKLVENRNFDKI